MSEEDLELFITMDDPGEDTLPDDTFYPPDPTEKSEPCDPPNATK